MPDLKSFAGIHRCDGMSEIIEVDEGPQRAVDRRPDAGGKTIDQRPVVDGHENGAGEGVETSLKPFA
jgi:hypothetical protein